VTVLLGFSFGFSSYSDPGEAIDFNIVSQLAKDWDTKPFIDIKVSDKPCEDGWENLFSKQWKGVDKYCEAANGNLYTEEGLKAFNKENNTEFKCKAALNAGAEPIEMNLIDGRSYICGKRGGEPYHKIIRPLNSEGEPQCPEGY
jgi:hypothetical protein